MQRMLGLVLAVLVSSLTLSAEEPLTKIAFGSCAQQENPLPIFAKIAAQKPQLYLALGDNIYADTVDLEVMKAKYKKLADNEGWQQLVKTCPILATWDDHDMGKNDAGADYPKREESQQIFCDFFKIPADSPIRKQKGVYSSKIFGPEGKRVQVILLDTRYHRSEMKRGKREPGMTYTPYIPNLDPKATVLGEEQWKWLEGELKKPAELRLLCSSIQIVAEDHGFEKWMNFPLERERLYKLLKETKANGVIILSGDRHLAEISCQTDAIDYPLFDVTSSGLNQADKKWRPAEKNKHRVGIMTHGDNFGIIQIDWSTPSPKVSMQIRDVEGEITLRETIPLTLLQPGSLVAKKEPKDPKSEFKPREGAISPAEALTKKGEKVVVEFRVLSTGMTKDGSRMFLNSEKNFRDKENLTIVLTKDARKGIWEKATGDTFLNKPIKVTGTVSEFNGSLQIEIKDEKMIEIIEEKK